MTHYLVVTQMPQGALEHMLDDLQRLQKFKMDIGFCMDNDLCICEESAKANVREIRFFEIDVATPATDSFEKWLGREGFQDLALGSNSGISYKAYSKNIPFLKRILLRIKRFILKILLKLFYLSADSIFGFTAAPFKDFYGNKGTKYLPFAPMSKRFKEELPTDYTKKYQSQFNQRNIVIGKMIEHPIGSFEERPCKRCGARYAGCD